VGAIEELRRRPQAPNVVRLSLADFILVQR
jgi:hypothetical protein